MRLGLDAREPLERSATRVALIACVVLASCADQEQPRGLEKPEPPAMRTLGAYGAPTAPLTLASVDELLGQASALVTAVDAIGIERTFIQSLGAALAQVNRSRAAQTREVTSELAVQAHALTLPGKGYVEIWRICDGWGATPVPSPDNGEIHMTAGFSEGAIDPVVWGTVTACRYRMSGREVHLDGTTSDPGDSDVRMFIGAGVEIDDLPNLAEPVVVELAARATVDGREVLASLDFRIDMRTRAVELLVPLDAGHVLVAVDPTRGASMQARASNGTFSCEVEARRCTGANGEEPRLP